MTDFIYDSENNKVLIGQSDYQHQKDILTMRVGWHKFNPTHGVGIADFIDDEVTETELKALIRREFERDGMTVNEIFFDTNGKIEIDANY